jgi:hypothetical protein
MKADTDKHTELIERLAANLPPAPRVPRPWVRAILWLAISVPFVAAVLTVMVLRNGLPAHTFDIRFTIELAAGLAAGLTAAACAFGSVVPAHHRRLLVFLILLLAVWVGSVGQSCLSELSQAGVSSMSLQHDLSCLPFIAFLSLLPAIVLVVMLRRGAPLTPHVTAGLGGIAAAGLGNLGLRLIFPESADFGLFIWHIGGVLVLAAVASAGGHFLLNWRSIR